MIAAAFHRSPDTIPAQAGAYALLIRLDAPLDVELPGRPAARLDTGHYVYCGSANGPGGLRARLGRHLRRDKTVRWHVDRLTTIGTALGAWVFPGGDECALVAGWSHLTVPIKGFGASDCRRCAAHLLRWTEPLPEA